MWQARRLHYLALLPDSCCGSEDACLAEEANSNTSRNAAIVTAIVRRVVIDQIMYLLIITAQPPIDHWYLLFVNLWRLAWAYCSDAAVGQKVAQNWAVYVVSLRYVYTQSTETIFCLDNKHSALPFANYHRRRCDQSLFVIIARMSCHEWRRPPRFSTLRYLSSFITVDIIVVCKSTIHFYAPTYSFTALYTVLCT